jgi:hypothetical protein
MGLSEARPALVRVVPVSLFDAKVAFDPATWQPSPPSPSRSEGLDLVLRIGTAASIPPAAEDGTGVAPTGVATLLAHGLALTDAGPHNAAVDGVLVVPDNVARVFLRPVRMDRAPVRVEPTSFGTATAAVHNNVAAYRLRLPTVTAPGAVSGVFATGGVAEVTWFDAAGKVIKTTTTNLGLFVRVAPSRTHTLSGGANNR